MRGRGQETCQPGILPSAVGQLEHLTPGASGAWILLLLVTPLARMRSIRLDHRPACDRPRRMNAAAGGRESVL